MNPVIIMPVIALLFSSIGFKKYVWFISIGYGFSVAGIGLGLLLFGAYKDAGIIAACILFILYGIRLGGYLTIREHNSSYNSKMKNEITSGDNITFFHKVAIWIAASLLYTLQTCPVTFRIINMKSSDTVLYTGLIISLTGLILETLSDIQKSSAKKRNPGRFVDTGLFRMVRCPNYFGEMLFWTGVFLGGITVYNTVLQWVAALLGYLGIVYVMFSGARRLEMRQNRTYGNDPEYQQYVKSTPIMIPVIPLYSVEKHKWLVG